MPDLRLANSPVLDFLCLQNEDGNVFSAEVFFSKLNEKIHFK